MYTRILVPFDASECSATALDAAIGLARARDGTVRLVHHFDEFAFPDARGEGHTLLEAAREAGTELLQCAARRAEAGGTRTESQLLVGGRKRLGRRIAGDARSWAGDLVVPGSHYSPTAGCAGSVSGDSFTGTWTPHSTLPWTGTIRGVPAGRLAQPGLPGSFAGCFPCHVHIMLGLWPPKQTLVPVIHSGSLRGPPNASDKKNARSKAGQVQN